MSALHQRRNRTNNNNVSKRNETVTKGQVKDMLNSFTSTTVEKKRIYGTFQGNATTTSAFEDMTITNQGALASNRIGDNILVTGFQFSLVFAGGDVTNICRVTIIRWNMNDGSDTFSLADLYQNAAVPWLSQLDKIQPNRYTLIFDKKYVIGSNGSDIVLEDRHLKLNNKVAYNVSQSTGIGKIYMIICSDSTATTHPVYSLEICTDFIDA